MLKNPSVEQNSKNNLAVEREIMTWLSGAADRNGGRQRRLQAKLSTQRPEIQENSEGMNPEDVED